MNKYILYPTLGILTLGMIVNSYLSYQSIQRIKSLEKANPYAIPSPQIAYPTTLPFATPTNMIQPTDIIRPMPKNLPEAIQEAYSWPVMSLCNDRSGYTLYYQLDDGSNIYIDSKGAYVRGKKVICTN